jgi:hypothetical protein
MRENNRDRETMEGRNNRQEDNSMRDKERTMV